MVEGVAIPDSEDAVLMGGSWVSGERAGSAAGWCDAMELADGVQRSSVEEKLAVEKGGELMGIPPLPLTPTVGVAVPVLSPLGVQIPLPLSEEEEASFKDAPGVSNTPPPAWYPGWPSLESSGVSNVEPSQMLETSLFVSERFPVIRARTAAGSVMMFVLSSAMIALSSLSLVIRDLQIPDSRWASKPDGASNFLLQPPTQLTFSSRRGLCTRAFAR